MYGDSSHVVHIILSEGLNQNFVYTLLSSCFLLSYAGSDGNFFKFEHCTFIGNHGLGTYRDYGAAVLVSLLTLFEQRVTLPRHEVINWYVL